MIPPLSLLPLRLPLAAHRHQTILTATPTPNNPPVSSSVVPSTSVFKTRPSKPATASYWREHGNNISCSDMPIRMYRHRCVLILPLPGATLLLHLHHRDFFSNESPRSLGHMNWPLSHDQQSLKITSWRIVVLLFSSPHRPAAPPPPLLLLLLCRRPGALLIQIMLLLLLLQ